MNIQNIKTAASESSKTWLQTENDLMLLQLIGLETDLICATDSKASGKELSGSVLKYLHERTCYLLQAWEKGQIRTAGCLELARSIETLGRNLSLEVWDFYYPSCSPFTKRETPKGSLFH